LNSILKKSPQWRWNEANRHRLQAHQAVRGALRKGVLKRWPCEITGSLRVDAHHPGYDRPLEIRWLSRRIHQRLHVLLKSGFCTDAAIAQLKSDYRREGLKC
jgi:hypothetical protein